MKKENTKNVKTPIKLGVTQYMESLNQASVRLDLIRFHLMSLIGSAQYMVKTEEVESQVLEQLLVKVEELESIIPGLLREVDFRFLDKLEKIRKEN